MSASTTLGNFLNRLVGVYQSIDIRIAAVKSDDAWHNALTVVRFSYMKPEDVEEQQKILANKWQKLETSNFKVDMEGLPFAELKTLSKGLSQGEWILVKDISSGALRKPEVQVQFGRSMDLVSLEGRFERHGYTRREEHSWPCFEAIAGGHCALLDNEQLQSEVKSQTYFDLYLLVSELLEVDFQRNISLDLIVNAPFYARIENVDFAEQKCKIQVKFHKDTKALAVSAVARRGERDESTVRDKASSPVTLQDSEESDAYMRLWTKEFELPSATPADYLSVSLMQTEPAALDIEKPSFSTQISRLLESKKVAEAPMVTAFSRFCSLDDLEEYLKSPSKLGLLKTGKDPSATFELAVTWLLGLCGFNIVWLGQTAHEALKENKVTLFSTDMLASHPESKSMLLLIGCTIGTPNDKDIDNLKSIRKILQDEVFKGTKLHIKPLVFSAAPELGNKERDGVKVLDAGDIRGILGQLKHGETKRALNQYFGHELGFGL